MKGKVEKKGLRTVNRSLTGILAAEEEWRCTGDL